MSKVHRALLVLKAAPMSGLYQICTVIESIVEYKAAVHGRHSSTRDHLVSEGLWEMCGGERVVLALGLGSGSIDNRPAVLWKNVFGAAPFVRVADTT